MNLFVYGSLMSDMCNHAVLKGCKLLHRGVILGRMFDLGGFPALKHHHRDVVWGEVYEVDWDILAMTDFLEGYNGKDKNNWYDRKFINVSVGVEGETVGAWVYYYVPPLYGYDKVKHGSWKAHLVERNAANEVRACEPLRLEAQSA